MENWRAVKGFEGIYSVSDIGRIRRDAGGQSTKPGRILNPYIARLGYVKIGLYLNGKRSERFVHVLVAEAFQGTADQSLEVNHKNGRKDDNRSSNLEWVTRSQNVAHAFRCLGRTPIRGELHGRTGLTESSIRKIRAMRASGSKQSVIAKRFGITTMAVSNILTGRRWGHVKGEV